MNFKLLSLVAITASLTSAPLFAGTTSFSEDFDGVGTSLYLTNVGQFHTINGTNVDVIDADGDGYFNAGYTPGALESGHVVDLGGTGGNPFGQLQTKIDLAAGNYILSFDLAGSQRPGYTSSTTTNVSLGTHANLASDLLLQSITQLSTDPATAFSYTFSSNGTPTYLTFSLVDTQNGNVGQLLDNVNVAPNLDAPFTSPTPEPSSLLLLGSGFAALAGFARRTFGDRKA